MLIVGLRRTSRWGERNVGGVNLFQRGVAFLGFFNQLIQLTHPSLVAAKAISPDPKSRQPKRQQLPQNHTRRAAPTSATHREFLSASFPLPFRSISLSNHRNIASRKLSTPENMGDYYRRDGNNRRPPKRRYRSGTKTRTMDGGDGDGIRTGADIWGRVQTTRMVITDGGADMIARIRCRN